MTSVSNLLYEQKFTVLAAELVTRTVENLSKFPMGNTQISLPNI